VRRLLLTASCALALAALSACGDNTNSTNSNTSNTNAANSNAVSSTTGGAMTTDGSEVARAEENGVVTETRTFKGGRVEKVVVTTRGGKRTARVYARDTGEIRELPEGKVDTALTATGDAIAASAGFVADKAEDVGRPVVNGAKAAGGQVADKAEDVGRGAVDRSKKVGGVVADKSEDVGRGVADRAVNAGKATAKGAKKVGGAVTNAIKH
jgi:ABC-type Fe3+-hydroxamate transport system substrate-binding protein